MTNILFLAFGGAVGTLLRYLISGKTYRVAESLYPWGTLVVNLGGSFAIGLLWGLLEIESLSPTIRNFLLIGVLGGFTTFSTFALENFHLLRDGEIKIALSNVLASNVFGIILVFIGYVISRHLVNYLR